MKEFGFTKQTLNITRAIRLATPCVLVADDEPANRLLIGKLLERLGCATVSVPSADDAVEATKVQHFDLILMDCSMPGKSGYDATREIRELETDGLQTPIVAFTASHESEVLDRSNEKHKNQEKKREKLKTA